MDKEDVARPDLPYAHSKAAIYLSKQIEALTEGGDKTQRELAKAMGYAVPNILSMFKRGETKIPIDRVPQMAKALDVDPGHLLRLVMEQHWPEHASTLAAVFGDVTSKNERTLITLWRAATANMDPIPKPKALRKLVEAPSPHS